MARLSFRPSFESLDNRQLMTAGLALAMPPAVEMSQHVAATLQAPGLGSPQTPTPFDPINANAGKEWAGVVVKFHHRGGVIYYDWAYRVTIDWGDGTTSAGSARLIELHMLGLDGTFEVTASHTYAKAGNYQIKVSVDVPAYDSHITDVTNTATVKNAAPVVLLPVAQPGGVPSIERAQNATHSAGLPIITEAAALAQTQAAMSPFKVVDDQHREHDDADDPRWLGVRVDGV